MADLASSGSGSGAGEKAEESSVDLLGLEEGSGGAPSHPQAGERGAGKGKRRGVGKVKDVKFDCVGVELWAVAMGG